MIPVVRLFGAGRAGQGHSLWLGLAHLPRCSVSTPPCPKASNLVQRQSTLAAKAGLVPLKMALFGLPVSVLGSYWCEEDGANLGLWGVRGSCSGSAKGCHGPGQTRWPSASVTEHLLVRGRYRHPHFLTLG